MTPTSLAAISLAALVVACAGTAPVARPSPTSPSAPAPPSAAAASRGECEPEVDREAILAMAGSYEVEFRFEETTALAPGYAPKPPSTSGATELVLVLESAPRRVSLQHVLVVSAGGSGRDRNVVKHWRQDWSFEDADVLEFEGKQRWKRRALPADAARCAWTQAVFEVDDGPRYEGYGRWRHDAAGSVWQSNEAWRPLPRREYTKRSDYDVLIAVNRHRITRDGWEHEQDNVKLVLEPRRALVREQGLNRYRRVSATATEPAARYWAATESFWGAVRKEWTRVLAERPTLELSLEVDGKRLYEPLFERAHALSVGTSSPGVEADFVRAKLEKHLVPAR